VFRFILSSALARPRNVGNRPTRFVRPRGPVFPLAAIDGLVIAVPSYDVFIRKARVSVAIVIESTPG
jgi:hypothetical protein